MIAARCSHRLHSGVGQQRLQQLNQNHSCAPHVEALALAYAHTEILRVPDRSIRPQILRPLLCACREKNHDFVLSRLRGEPEVLDESEHGREGELWQVERRAKAQRWH